MWFLLISLILAALVLGAEVGQCWMKRAFPFFLVVAALMVGTLVRGAPLQHAILTYHGDLSRDGHFIVPGLTWERARSLHLDSGFHAEITGHVQAQPLYWKPPGSGRPLLIVATEENTVYALDARTGRMVWKRALGPPVQRAALKCGDIVPLGVTGAPVIDPASGTLYLDAAVARPEGMRHLVFALGLKDGAIVPGWPVNITEALAGKEPTFHAHVQNQRGALAIVAGTVYVPFGSFFDCGTYHGTVVGISTSDPGRVTRWATRAAGGGIWAPGGIVSDGASLFVATGNTVGVTDWTDGEAVLRLPLDLKHSARKRDFFAPADWHSLDEIDADLGGIAPLLINLPAGKGPRKLILAIGKNGKAYLLDRTRLGGIGGALAITKVSTHGVYAGAAAYPLGRSVYVAFSSSGAGCPKAAVPQRGLIAVAIRGGNPPTLAVAWCAQMEGFSAPIVTTSDGQSNPIVWALGAQGDNRLHGFRGDTGEVLFDGPPAGLAGLHRLQTLIATQKRLFVGADDTIYAFAF